MNGCYAPCDELVLSVLKSMFVPKSMDVMMCVIELVLRMLRPEGMRMPFVCWVLMPCSSLLELVLYMPRALDRMYHVWEVASAVLRVELVLYMPRILGVLEAITKVRNLCSVRCECWMV